MNIFMYVAICLVVELIWVFTMLSKANRLQASGEEARAENYFIVGIVSIWAGPMIFIFLGLAIATAIWDGKGVSYAGHPQSNFFLKSANEDYIYLANDVSVVRACNSIADISLKQLIILQSRGEKSLYLFGAIFAFNFGSSNGINQQIAAKFYIWNTI